MSPKTILLVTPYLTADWDIGKLVMRALSQMGHRLVLWDAFTSRNPPNTEYDLSLVMKGHSVVDPYQQLRQDRPKVCWFPDHLWLFDGIDEYIDGYDYFFTISKESRGIFLPGAADPIIHYPYPNQPLKYDIIYIGTAYPKCKVDFMRRFILRSKTERWSFNIFGNDWQQYGIKADPPQYLTNFSKVCAQSKLVLNLNDDLYGVGPTRKIHEVASCGTALIILDKATGQDETYPMVPQFRSIDDAIELIRYYLNHAQERFELVQAMQAIAHEKYTYEHQLGVILEHVYGS